MKEKKDIVKLSDESKKRIRNRVKLKKRITATNRDRAYKKVAIVTVVTVLVIYSTMYAFLKIVTSRDGFMQISSAPSQLKDKNISLSLRRDFKEKTTSLRTKINKNMNNITYAWLPSTIGNKDGDDSRHNFVVYTFYLKNTGLEPVKYSEEITMVTSTKGAEKALRVMVLKDNELPQVYAAPKGVTKEPEFIGDETTPKAKNFLSDTVVYKRSVINFKKGDVVKYTLVVWFEGEDPECTDDILGGEVKVGMYFEVIG